MVDQKKIELKKFDINGDLIGSYSVPEKLSHEISDPHKLIKDWVTFFRFNNRQWSAHTKTRSEVAHSTKKIRQQKGSGRARAGGITAPQRVGGGRVGTPRAKFNQSKRLNKKQSINAFSIALEQAFANKSICIKNMYINLNVPKCKMVDLFLKKTGTVRRPLFVYSINNAEDKEHINIFSRSIRNIPKAKMVCAKDVNVYDLLLCHHLIITENAVHETLKRTNLQMAINSGEVIQ